jgi:glyoxylase-like metal-dependent hydrolase (beta-lactamase superfamily II)
MIHEILPVGPLRCNCSIIGDETTHEAMVIDPGDDIDDIQAVIRKHKLQVKQIVITHAHIDHVGGAMKLRASTGAPILLNQNDHGLLKMLDAQAAWIGVPAPGKVEIDRSIGDGDKVTAGSIEAHVLETPGHTEGSICLFIFDEGSIKKDESVSDWLAKVKPGDKPLTHKLIAGDTLFAGSIGRTDLPGGSTEKIMRSLHHIATSLPDNTLVIPGHGPLTTISDEKENNPYLAKR